MGGGGNVTVTFAVLSYAGALTITVTADPDSMSDLAQTTAALQAELDALTDLANTPTRPIPENGVVPTVVPTPDGPAGAMTTRHRHHREESRIIPTSDERSVGDEHPHARRDRNGVDRIGGGPCEPPSRSSPTRRSTGPRR